MRLWKIYLKNENCVHFSVNAGCFSDNSSSSFALIMFDFFKCLSNHLDATVIGVVRFELLRKISLLSDEWSVLHFVGFSLISDVVVIEVLKFYRASMPFSKRMLHILIFLRWIQRFGSHPVFHPYV